MLRLSKSLVMASAFALGACINASAWACNTSSGQVAKVEAKSNKLVMSQPSCCGGNGEMTFTVKSATKVTINGKSATLAELKPGDAVKVDFEKTDDVLAITATREG